MTEGRDGGRCSGGACSGSNAAPLAHGYDGPALRPAALAVGARLPWVSYPSIGDENSLGRPCTDRHPWSESSRRVVYMYPAVSSICNTHWIFDGEYSTTLATPYM